MDPLSAIVRRFTPPPARFATLLRKPFSVDLDEHTLRFADAAAFAFSLASRTSVPSSRLVRLHQRSVAELQAEAIDLAAVQNHLRGIIEDFDQHHIDYADGIARIGLTTFSKDHRWRSIFAHILTSVRPSNIYARIALETYLGYLTERQTALNLICSLKQPPAKASSAHAAVTAHVLTRDTISFDAGVEEFHFTRLPQGRATTVYARPGEGIALNLAGHSFALKADTDWALVGDDGERHVLRAGVNSIGRSSANDIVVKASYSKVSRRHLLAEPLGPDIIALTDLSTYGTFVAPTVLSH